MRRRRRGEVVMEVTRVACLQPHSPLLREVERLWRSRDLRQRHKHRVGRLLRRVDELNSRRPHAAHFDVHRGRIVAKPRPAHGERHAARQAADGGTDGVDACDALEVKQRMPHDIHAARLGHR